MEYITTKEAAEKWGISTIRITVLAREGRIPGAQRLGKSWLIPATATKPAELKANHSGSVRKKTSNFSFPLYHFRPDWIYVKKTQLSEQQQSLLAAENAVLECRFADAYPLLESILSSPDDIYTEIGSLWNAGICYIALNKPEEFSRIYLRLQMVLSEDFPHRDDLGIILDILKTYVQTIGSVASTDNCNMDIHDQCLPLLFLQIGYANLTREAMNTGAADTTLLELNLRFLQTTSSVISIEMMHCYLLGIYYLRHNLTEAERHAKAAAQIAFENKYYFPIVTYYSYFTQVLSPVLAQYPKEFQNHCHELISQYKVNYTTFLSSINEYTVFSKLANADYPIIYGVLMGLTNADIAEKLGVHPQTVKFRLSMLFRKLGVKNKKELSDYLHNYM